jgi:lysophospholipase L1-like esterase
MSSNVSIYSKLTETIIDDEIGEGDFNVSHMRDDENDEDSSGKVLLKDMIQLSDSPDSTAQPQASSKVPRDYFLECLLVLICLAVVFLGLYQIVGNKASFRVVYYSAVSFDEVEYIGRVSASESGTLQSQWPNTGVRMTVVANSNQVTVSATFADCLSGCNSYVTIDKDCSTIQKFLVNSDNQIISQKIDTIPGEIYEIAIRKVTETLCVDAYGVLELESIDLNGGSVVQTEDYPGTSCSSSYKLLVFGDSYTCGYGVDKIDPCPFTAASEDVTHAYAYLTAKSLLSDIHIIAWSGKGIVRNCADVNPISVDPLPIYYNRTLGAQIATDQTNYWKPNSYKPDLAWIMLGTNDYSTEPHPSDEQFVNGYLSLVARIQKDYSLPSSKILFICAPGSPSVQCTNIKAAADKAQVNYFAIPDDVWAGGRGCDGHPSSATQQNMASALIPTVEKLLLN